MPITKIHSTNGHLSPLANTVMTNDDTPSDSESDLSEINDPPAAEASPSTSSSEQHQSEFGNEDIESSGSDNAANDAASDDGDFDMDEAVNETRGHSARIDRSSSHDSRRPSKRKVGLEDDIMANPELYGLRRSVCITISWRWRHLLIPRTEPASPASTHCEQPSSLLHTLQ
jgi:chromodomain-helicase-DNA-binding protein 1